MTKYKQYVQSMFEQHAEVFAKFQPIHDGYTLDRKKWSKAFHEQGQPVMEILHDWEQRLCSGMERGQHAAYSARLAEKFWAEVKKRFPRIEMVGVRSNLD